jgi:hypothetical protein
MIDFVDPRVVQVAVDQLHRHMLSMLSEPDEKTYSSILDDIRYLESLGYQPLVYKTHFAIRAIRKDVFAKIQEFAHEHTSLTHISGDPIAVVKPGGDDSKPGAETNNVGADEAHSSLPPRVDWFGDLSDNPH